MRKISSENDFNAVSRVLHNFYVAHPHPQNFQQKTPANIVDDYSLYLALKDFMTQQGLINQIGGSDNFVISQKGIEIVEKYNGDVRLYNKPEQIEDNFDFYIPSSKGAKGNKKKKNRLMKRLTLIGFVVGLISGLLTIWESEIWKNIFQWIKSFF